MYKAIISKRQKTRGLRRTGWGRQKGDYYLKNETSFLLKKILQRGTNVKKASFPSRAITRFVYFENAKAGFIKFQLKFVLF